MSALFETKAYLRHLLKAGGPHSVHSPLVFELITQVLADQKTFACFDELEKIRRQLWINDALIHVDDFGAGSRTVNSRERKISQIARHALQSKKCARSLFRIAHHFNPENILELGTSFGVTTAYLGSVSGKIKVTGIEGAPEVADIARKTVNAAGLKNVEIITGKFDDVLPRYLKANPTVDMAIIDGNHTFAATVNYFETLIPHCHAKSILVFDDIHWSIGMEKAWNTIVQNPAVMISIDFFHFGLIFFGYSKEKQHFTLRLP